MTTEGIDPMEAVTIDNATEHDREILAHLRDATDTKGLSAEALGRLGTLIKAGHIKPIRTRARGRQARFIFKITDQGRNLVDELDGRAAK